MWEPVSAAGARVEIHVEGGGETQLLPPKPHSSVYYYTNAHRLRCI
jgi:hypothetical protein